MSYASPTILAPDPVVTIYRVGSSREPVVTIDDFLGNIDALEEVARQADYAPAQGYPGLRYRISSMIMADRAPLLRRIFAEVFDLPAGARFESCSFSLVSLPPSELAQGQRRPHYDEAGSNVLAMVHYFGDEASGGTAFYRHRRSGIETVTKANEQAFAAAVKADEAEFGPLPPRYFRESDLRYEMIGDVPARRNRVAIYRGCLLHSGHIPVDPDPATVMGKRRLTINAFLVGHA